MIHEKPLAESVLGQDMFAAWLVSHSLIVAPDCALPQDYLDVHRLGARPISPACKQS